VTQKALFLLAFSSGARLSELAALQTPPFFTPEAMTLSFDPIFIPKQTRAPRAHTALAPLRVLRLPVADCLVCPVSALQQYAVLHDEHPSPAPLWRHPLSGVKATPRHLAAWLRAVIAAAYRRARRQPPPTFTPHSIRAAAASWAWHANVPLATILQQCRWAHETTFSRFYLRRVAESDGVVHRLKPLAVTAML
jgi:integrase